MARKRKRKNKEIIDNNNFNLDDLDDLDDLDNLDDLDDLDELDDLDTLNQNSSSDLGIFSDDDFLNDEILLEDNDVKKKPKTKKKSPIIKIVSIIATVGIIFGGGYYAYTNDLIPTNALGTNDSQNENENENENDHQEASRDVTMELINTEQVFWAENVCNAMSTWGEDLNLKNVPSPKGNKPYSSIQASKEISNVLKENSKILETRANQIQESVSNAYNEAKSFEKGTILTDNNKKVGQSPDTKITSASSNINMSLRAYADGLKSMAADLQSKAGYDFNGQRDTISMISQALEGMENDLSNMLSKEINDELFDNTMTMLRVSQLEACGGKIIDGSELDRERSEQISEQENIRNYINYRRCEAFMSDRERFGGSEFKSSEEACSQVLKENIFTGDEPIYSWNINTQDELRVKPDNIPDDIIDSYSDNNNDLTTNEKIDYDSSEEDSSQQDSEKDSSDVDENNKNER